MLLTGPIERCALALRDSARHQDGFTIIEVMVSAVLVAMSAIGVFAALDSASATSGRDKARNIAAQLAESDQERMRAMKLSTINNLRETRTESSDGDSFTVTSRADWVNDASGTQSCTGANSTFDYLKIRSTVTWTGMGSTKPIVSDSLRSVPNGAFNSSQGSLAIQISDRDGTGLSGINVSVSGAKSFNETTNSNGCIFIGYIPAGTYTVSFGQAGFVESLLPNDSNVVDSVVVQGQQTANQQYLYDDASAIQVRFRTRAIGAGSDSNTTGEAFTAANSGLGATPYKFFCSGVCPSSGTPTLTAGLTGSGLFPFANSYAYWAGACAEAKPTSNGQASDLVTAVTPGATAGSPTGLDAWEPSVRVPVSGGSSNTRRVVVTPSVAACAAKTAIGPNNNTNFDFTLPYGNYSVCAQATVSGTVRRETAALANNVRNGKTMSTITIGSTDTSGACP